jgi:hypothetical protein
MNVLNRTSLELRDGSGYVGMLGVFHELHCLVCTRNSPILSEPKAKQVQKLIRHLIHKESYPEDHTPGKMPEVLAHVGMFFFISMSSRRI